LYITSFVVGGLEVADFGAVAELGQHAGVQDFDVDNGKYAVFFKDE